MDAEEVDEDLGAVVKGDEPKKDYAKKVKQDGSIKSSNKGEKPMKMKEETRSIEKF